MINLTGLSSGLACALFIYLWIADEWQVDRFHQTDALLYQVMENTHTDNGIVTSRSTPDLLAENIEKEFPEIAHAVVATPNEWNITVTLETGQHHVKPQATFASPAYFTLFSFPIVAGASQQPLADPLSAVISASLARQLFGDINNAIGKTVSWQLLQFKEQAQVSAVFDDMPAYATERADIILPFEAFKLLSQKTGRNINWYNHAPYTYILLQPGTDVAAFNGKIKDYIRTKVPSSNVDLFVRPFSDGYLYGHYENGQAAGGRIVYLRLFGLIAVFIVVMACINFMNLSTAKAVARSKAVGIQKAVGAARSQLMVQYLGESMLITCLAAVLAIVVVQLLLPAFNLLTGKHILLTWNMSWCLVLLGLVVLTGLLAGSYPALYLSGFNPAKVLKGKLQASHGEAWARRSLVVFQFTLSIVFMVGVMVVYRQIDYIQTKNLGYNKDHLIYFPIEGNIAHNLPTFVEQIRQVPGVSHAAATGHKIIDAGSSTSGVSWSGKNENDIVTFENISCGDGYIETLGIKMLAGQSFSQTPSDSNALIFNEAAIATMQLKDPIGEHVNLWGKDHVIIGVVQDFHYRSLHEPVKPLFFRIDPARALNVMVRIQPGQEVAALQALTNLYKKINPGFDFQYTFLDENYQQLYAGEKRVSLLSRYFAGLAMVISCLGLLGLAALTAERRTRELGIRKVLGAGEWTLTRMLLHDFTRLVLVALLVGLPLSYWACAWWLDTFSFRITLDISYFVIAAGLSFAMAWMTVASQAWSAVRQNPSKSLRAD